MLSSHQSNHTFEFVDNVLLLKQGRDLGLKPAVDPTGGNLSHPYNLSMRVADLMDTPGLCLCVTRLEIRGD